jgi:hypothetical protein
MIKFGSDKSSKIHNYTRYYEQYFEKIRNENLKILEIGVQFGYSMKAWKEYFQNSIIYGIDIGDCGNLAEDRAVILKGDQSDKLFLKETNTKYGPFNIIIDDGSHRNSDMIISYETLFPLLKNGGVYVVEDLHCCYWGWDDSTSFIDVIIKDKLIDAINASGKLGVADRNNVKLDSWYPKLGELNWDEENIKAIHQYRSIIFIEKR